MRGEESRERVRIGSEGGLTGNDRGGNLSTVDT